MRAIYLASSVALVLAVDPVEAQTDDVLIAPAPAWVETLESAPVPPDAAGTVFVRRSNVIVHLEEEGQYTHSSQRVKLLHAQALSAGNLSLSWNPASGAPVVHMLRIHREGDEIDVLASNSFEVIRREDQLEQARINGLLTAVLQVPNLRVGDELEWSFTIPSHDPTLGNDSFGLLALGRSVQPGRHRFGLSWEEGQQPNVRLTEDLTGFERRTPRSLVISLENPETISPPSDAPPRYNWQRVIEFSDFASWPAVSQRFNALFATASQLSPDSPIRQEAARIARAHSGEFERAQAALELVQQQVRYIYVGLNGGNFQPATAEETWRRRYGDCKGKSALLLALLRELDIEAEIVLASNSGSDDGIDDRLPSPALFDHVLVRADIGSATYWLDATLPAVAEPGLRPFLPYRSVLPLSARGSALESVPQQRFELPQTMGLVEIDARADFDQPARKINISVSRGVNGLANHIQYSALSPQQLTTAFRNALAGQGDWEMIEDVTYRYDRETRASILTIVGTGRVDWEDRGNGRYTLELPGGGFYPPERRQRASGEGDDAPFYNEPRYSCYATTVRLPEGTATESWGFNSTFDTLIFGRIYYRAMERREDGTIRMVRGSRTEDREIPPERARRDNERLEDFDNSRARIEYDPNREMRIWGISHSVPATYEIDWSGRNAPCLPEYMLEGD